MLHLLHVVFAALCLGFALFLSPTVYVEFYHHHGEITPSDVSDWLSSLNLTGALPPPAPPPETGSWLWSSSASSASMVPQKNLAVPTWLRLAKACLLTLFTAGVILSAPATERPRGRLLLPVPLGFLALRGTGWLAARLLTIWLPIWLAACLYTNLAFHAMASSLCLTACSIAGGWRGHGGDAGLAASWLLATAAVTLLFDAMVETLAKVVLFQPASAWSYLSVCLLPQLAVAFIFVKIHQLHSHWDAPAYVVLRRSDTLSSEYTLSLRRLALSLVAPSGPLASYRRRLQILGLLLAVHAVRLFFVPYLHGPAVPGWLRVALLDGPAVGFLSFAYVVNDWDRCWGSGALSDQRSWAFAERGSGGRRELECTCSCDADDDVAIPRDYKGKSTPAKGHAGPTRPVKEASAAKGAVAPLDRVQVFASVTQLLNPDAASFDVRVFILLYGDAGRGFRTHAHAEAVVEIREHREATDARGSSGSSLAAPAMVVKVGYFLDQVSILTVEGRGVTDLWPAPGYKEANYTGKNVLLAGPTGEPTWAGSCAPSFGLTGWSRDQVEDGLRRTINLASHPFPRGYAKIPQPGEYNCFAYSLSAIGIWLGQACPLEALGSLRTIWCLFWASGIGVETWGAAMLMMLLQLPQPLNYAFGHSILELDRGMKAASKIFAPTPPRSVVDALGRLVQVLMPMAVSLTESVIFILALIWLAVKIIASNNFGLICGLAFLLVTPISALWRISS